jgi:hypothetical protein
VVPAGATTGNIVVTTDVASNGVPFTVTVHTGDPADVLTYHNDNARTGQNLNENTLTLSNVNSQVFGKLFSHDVDGFIYSQPLFVSNVAVPALGFAMLSVEHSTTVLCVDADDGGQDELWHVSFIDPDNGVTPVPPEISEAMTLEIGIT